MSADRDYYLMRAEEELRCGERAATKCAADAHFELAGRYFDLAYRGIAALRSRPRPSLPGRPREKSK